MPHAIVVAIAASFETSQNVPVIIFADPFPFPVAKPIDLCIVLLDFSASADLAGRKSPDVVNGRWHRCGNPCHAY